MMKAKKSMIIKSKVVLWDDLVTKYTEEGFDALTPAQMVYYSVSLLVGEVYNGGFDQYFFNSASNLIYHAVDGLKELGATNSLSILERAMVTLFPNGQIPVDIVERRNRLHNLPNQNEPRPEWMNIENELNHEFGEDPDGIEERLEAFAVKNNLYELSDTTFDMNDASSDQSSWTWE